MKDYGRCCNCRCQVSTVMGITCCVWNRRFASTSKSCRKDASPRLVAHGRTVGEVLEIARDVARKLIAARRKREGRQIRASRSTPLSRQYGETGALIVDGHEFSRTDRPRPAGSWP
jgi:hypothetical protein